MTTVLICDDSEIVRMGLRMIVDTEPDLRVAGEAATGEEAVAAVERLRPDVVLLDIQLPGMDGIEAARRILTHDGPTRVLVLTTFDLDDYVYAALRAGASGYLVKDTPPEQLVDAIRTVAAGNAQLSPTVTRKLLDTVAANLPDPTTHPALTRLSTQDRELLRLIARGHTNNEIAAALDLRPTTVKTYVSRLFTKIGARDRTHAAVLAYDHGIARPAP